MPVTISGTGSITGAGLNKKIEAFTASGTWTVPAGVTYAIAHMIGGGGGVGQNTASGDGGSSSVAFSGGTVSAPGLTKNVVFVAGTLVPYAGPANSGMSATGYSVSSVSDTGQGSVAQYVVAGGDVTPASSITVTVGAGGVAGSNGAAGGSGYVYIEYYAD